MAERLENPGAADRRDGDGEDEERELNGRRLTAEAGERAHSSFAVTTKPITTMLASAVMNQPKCASSLSRIQSPK